VRLIFKHYSTRSTSKVTSLGDYNSFSEDAPSESDSGEKDAELQFEPSSRAVPSDHYHPNPASRLRPRPADYEVLTSAELAERLKVRESWVIDQSKRSRTSDPIPIFRLGKHRRYRWGSPELNNWLDRRAGHTQQQRKAEPKHKEER
jgi:hypothetical protein